MKQKKPQADTEKERMWTLIRKCQDESITSSQSLPVEVLQQTVGNQAVQRLHRADAPQANVEIDSPGDGSEWQAERVAETVVGISDADVRDSSARRDLFYRGTRKMHGAGRSLRDTDRSFFEPRFGYDLSDVRIHTDDRANELARSLNAKAYTVGQDIVFQSGAYAPGTSKGKHLLAHELTHVVQQGQPAATEMIQRQVDIWETVKSFGRGLADIPEDLARGSRRWLESINVFNPERSAEIGYQNERALNAIGRVVTDADVVYDVIKHIIADYIERLPSEVQARIRGQMERMGGNVVGYILGRIAGTTVITMLIRMGVRRLASRLGVSGASGATGVGLPVGFAVIQGVIDRAAESAKRLKTENPQLWNRLYREDVEMLWFLVEPHIGSIHDAIREELRTQFGVREPIDSGPERRVPIASGPQRRQPIASGPQRRQPIASGGSRDSQ
jgi:hypothetical protein